MQEELRFKIGDSVNAGRFDYKKAHDHTGKVVEVLAETLYNVKISSCSCDKCPGKVLTFYAWDLTPM